MCHSSYIYLILINWDIFFFYKLEVSKYSETIHWLLIDMDYSCLLLFITWNLKITSAGCVVGFLNFLENSTTVARKIIISVSLKVDCQKRWFINGFKLKQYHTIRVSFGDSKSGSTQGPLHPTPSSSRPKGRTPVAVISPDFFSYVYFVFISERLKFRRHLESNRFSEIWKKKNKIRALL